MVAPFRTKKKLNGKVYKMATVVLKTDYVKLVCDCGRIHKLTRKGENDLNVETREPKSQNPVDALFGRKLEPETE